MDTSHVRKGSRWLIAAMLAAFGACGGDSPTSPGGGGGGGGGTMTTSVTVEDFSFGPAAIVVDPGANVTWTWDSGVSVDHNVTFSDASIMDSPTQSTGTHSAAMPTTPGTYSYQCTIHPGSMQGTVTVQ